MLGLMQKTEQRGKTTEPVRPMVEADRERFHTFLKIAAESPFSGERANALDAAKRLATRHGMTLQEAARAPEAVPEPPPPLHEAAREYTAREMADIISLSEARLKAEKERYERALREAMARGLDGGARATAGQSGFAQARSRSNGRKRDSQSYATVLLNETSLPLSEIVSLTGLDIYKVVGLKLKMRSMAAAATS